MSSLRDVRIEDGTVNIVYDDKGTEKRVEHIAANLSLPTLAEPFTGRGKFDWKGETVDFDITLTTVADLREKRPAKLVLALDTPAIAARFDGSVVTRPEFSGEGELSAKAHSIPSLLAWMREKPAAVDGDRRRRACQSRRLEEGRDHLQQCALCARTCERARPGGRDIAVAAAACPGGACARYLDLNPFLSSGEG